MHPTPLVLTLQTRAFNPTPPDSLPSRDVELAIKRFEASELSAIIEYRDVMQVIERTHALFSDDLLQIDPFDSILHEVRAAGDRSQHVGDGLDHHVVG